MSLRTTRSLEVVFHFVFITFVSFWALSWVGVFFVALALISLLGKALHSAKLRLNIFLILNILSWFLLPWIWYEPRHFEPLPVVEIFINRAIVLIFISSIALAVIGQQSRRTQGLFLIGSLMAYAFFQVPETPVTRANRIVFLFFGAYKFFVLPLAFAIFFTLNDSTFATRIKAVSMSLPFWSVGTMMPITHGTNSRAYEADIAEPFQIQSLRSASRLALGVAVTFVFWLGIEFLIFGKPNTFYPHPFISNPLGWFSNVNDLSAGFDRGLQPSAIPETALRWLSVIFSFLAVYLNRTVFFNFFVVCARLAGFQLQSNFNAPWKARSLNEFYGRILFYYGRLLNLIFFPLFKELTANRGNRIWRFHIAYFGAVSLGGFYIHFVRDFKSVFRGDFFSTLIEYAPTLIYFVAIATLVVISNVWRQKTSAQEYFISSIWIQGLRAFIYLIVWSLTYTLYIATYHAKTTPDLYLSFVRGLVPW